MGLQYVQTDPTGFLFKKPYGTVVDDDWIVQNSHGPFSRAAAPRGMAFPHFEGMAAKRSRQYDHWWPLLEMEDNSDRTTDEIIREFRKTQGEEAWVQKLNWLMEWVKTNLVAEIMWRSNATTMVEWEDVRDDGSSDCAAC